MEKIKELPKIKEILKDECLASQEVYESKEKYKVVFINEKLYEEVFNEKYEWEKASKKISDLFSITLNKEISNKNVIGNAFADKQIDPSGIALSNNLGSGRAFFYGSNFNIKGDKTKLAVSPNPLYSNGKFALSAAIKESVLCNILSRDFIIKSYGSLAILVKNEMFDFMDEYLDIDDIVKNNVYNLPCAIEVRYYKNKELYRISNSFINEDRYTKKDIEELSKKIAKIEANKFIDRFFHGSWSSGNITTEGNLIDFDTSTFVRYRFPQYSNTINFKSNYFGYELLGQKLMINSIIENSNIEDVENFKSKIETLIDNTYEEHLKIKFCDLIGLNYEEHYNLYKSDIDYLCNKFNILCRKFLPNYYETNIGENNGNITSIFDFSRFFQKHLIEKEKTKYSIFDGINLLLNKTVNVKYKYPGKRKERIEEFFSNELVEDNQKDKILLEGMEFVKKYDELFYKVAEKYNLSEIKLKQYIKNSNRNYISDGAIIYGKLSYFYETKQMDLKTLNIIINALINTNLKNNYDNKKEILMNLKLYKNCLSYIAISEKYYYIIVETFSDIEIDFAKAIVNDEELILKHNTNGNGKIMISEKKSYTSLAEINEYELIINGDIVEE